MILDQLEQCLIKKNLIKDVIQKFSLSTCSWPLYIFLSNSYNFEGCDI